MLLVLLFPGFVEYLGSENFIKSQPKSFSALFSGIVLAKCFHSQLWEDSPYVSRQLSGIGVAMSSQLVLSGKTSFDSLLDSNPRDLERVSWTIILFLSYLPAIMLNQCCPISSTKY